MTVLGPEVSRIVRLLLAIFRPFVAKGFFAFLGLIHGSILHRLFINTGGTAAI